MNGDTAAEEQIGEHLLNYEPSYPAGKQVLTIYVWWSYSFEAP
jgi:hypothetical protein